LKVAVLLHTREKSVANTYFVNLYEEREIII